MTASAVAAGADGKPRCAWCLGYDDYVAYHDAEWGFPVGDDTLLFEKICLEGFQSGLSWLTILRKREAFRRAFAGFNFRSLSRFGARQVDELLLDAGIVRHRGKIESTIQNARRMGELVDEFGSFGAYVWRFEGDEAAALSKDLKRRGWTFVGPTTLHAFMQAMGLVNDHAPGCATRRRAAAARKAFRRP